MTDTYNASSLTYDAASVTYEGDAYGPLPFPIVGVFIAWNDGPYVANPGWTEITPYVRAVSTRRGRSDDFEQFDTGTAQLVLDNRARTFDPFYDPGVLRTNLLPNPSFETGVTGWAGSGTAAATIATSTAQSLFGNNSMAATATVAGNTRVYYSGTTGSTAGTAATRIPVTAGATYALSAYFRAATVGRICDVIVEWYNAANAQISTPESADVLNTATGWTRSATFTTVAPVGAVTATISVRVQNCLAGEVHYIDGVLFEQAPTVGTYFDGTTFPPGEMGTGVTSWTGTADASTSQLNQFPGKLRLTPRRQIRIVGQANGVNYDIFRGFVAGWPVTWTDAGYDSTVTIQAFDALGLMAGEVVPTDWLEDYTLSINPAHYWKSNDSQGSPTILDEMGGLPIKKFSDVNFFEEDALARGATGSARFIYEGHNGFVNELPNIGNLQSSWTLSFWAQMNGTVQGVSQMQYTLNTPVTVIRYFHQTSAGVPAGTFRIDTQSNVMTTHYYEVGQQINPALANHFAFRFNYATNNMTLYINAQLVPLVKYTGAGGFDPNSRESIYIRGMTVQEISVYRRELSATEIQTIFNYGSARLTETTTARMNRLINTTEWPSALTSFPASPAASVSELGTGTGVVPEMQLVADSEGGELYVSKSGVLTMTNRTDVFNAPRSSTSQATITDSGAGLGYGTELQIDYDADSLSNDVTVTFSGEGEVNAYSDAVIEAYGAAAVTIETQLADPTSAAQLATMELGVQGSLVPRISPLDLSVNTSQSDWQTILGLELLDRVTFKRTPTVGNQFSREALVNAIEHTIEPGSWSTSVQLSMRYTSPLICDDDVLGTVDFNYCG